MLLPILTFSISVTAQSNNIIQLPAPSEVGGKPLMQCLKERQSSRNFDNVDLPLSVISDLLWAANGINRPESGKLTVPTALNKQNMELYLVNDSGIWFYNAKELTISLINKGNYMSYTGKQDFVDKATVNIIIVADMDKLGKMETEDKLLYSGIHAGAIIQNIYLFCASSDLNTVTRRSFDSEKLSAAMFLPVHKTIILCQSVGKTKN